MSSGVQRQRAPTRAHAERLAVRSLKSYALILGTNSAHSRYNLKRRVASLPPLSSDIFTDKVLANQATAAATAANASFERICSPCQRTYYSENAYQNHLQSQKHRLRLAQLADVQSTVGEDEIGSMMSSAFSLGESVETKLEAPGDAVPEAELSNIVDGIAKASIGDQSSMSEKPAELGSSANGHRPERTLSSSREHEISQSAEDDSSMLEKCLFCNADSDTLNANIDHMKTKHGLFIPEQSYLVDLKGLIRWLHDRVAYLHECLFCGMVRPTTVGIQTHMRDKGHCMVAFESEEQMVEVGQFYDFRSSYSDGGMDEEEDEEESQRPGAGLGAKRKEEIIEGAEDGDEDMADGDGWQTDEEDRETETKPSQTKPARRSKRPDLLPAYHDEDGLHLPSGRIAGHRSLARFFRQNLHSYPSPEERISRRAIGNGSTEDGDTLMGESTVIQRVPRGRPQNAVTRADGGLGMLGVSDAKKHEAKKIEQAGMKRGQRAEDKYRWRLEKRGNQQKHFRVWQHDRARRNRIPLTFLHRILFSSSTLIKQRLGHGHTIATAHEKTYRVRKRIE